MNFCRVPAGLLLPVLLLAAMGSNHAASAFDSHAWASVRAQFNLSSDYIHLASFYIAPHPRSGILITVHDYYAHHESIHFAAEKNGTS